MRNEQRNAVMYAAMIAMTLIASTANSQVAERTPLVEFHINSQPLAQALNVWAQQSGLQLIWPGGHEMARNHSRSLYGKYEPMRALELLLQDSGLKYSVLSQGTVTLEDRNADKSTVVSVKSESE